MALWSFLSQNISFLLSITTSPVIVCMGSAVQQIISQGSYRERVIMTSARYNYILLPSSYRCCHVVPLMASLSGQILESKVTVFCWAPICPSIHVPIISFNSHNTLTKQTLESSDYRLGYWNPKRNSIYSTSRLVSPLHCLWLSKSDPMYQQSYYLYIIDT